MTLAVIVLAAGQGTRMNSDLAKVLHPLAGVPLLHHALAAARAQDPARIIVVTGHEGAAVASAARAFDDSVEMVEQPERLGTAHAVAQALPRLQGFTGDVLVLYGDTPFLGDDTLHAMRQARARHDVVALGFVAADPGRYGRMLADGERLLSIVEWIDASPKERDINLCNCGVLLTSAPRLAQWTSRVTNTNAAGEYYLTDVPALANADGASAGVVVCPESETLGINTRAELAAAEAAFQARARAAALQDGVTLTAPETVFFARDTVIGRDALIGPAVIFGPGVTIESGAEVRGFCHLEGCHISRGAVVGPFTRLRAGAELAEDVHVGNFVEVKNAILGEGVKAGHLAYIGDADIGPATNIGAGTVTCNYDGVMKHRTTIGRDVFIGSDTMLVAPVTIGDGAMTAAGSVITTDVPAGAMAIGRARQETRPGLALRLIDRLRAIKAGRK